MPYQAGAIAGLKRDLARDDAMLAELEASEQAIALQLFNVRSFIHRKKQIRAELQKILDARLAGHDVLWADGQWTIKETAHVA